MIIPFSDVETEAQRGDITCTKSHSWQKAGAGFKHRLWDFRAKALKHSIIATNFLTLLEPQFPNKGVVKIFKEMSSLNT